ncbi:unnamed protein product [Somion occarium]|uniref:Het-C-domain-containing protein n=1 Tax=Somion occarium TaxID=3059160 RepID=A0ABP1CF20_9APHY
MNNFTTTLLILTVLVVLLPTETYAFGAGDIPDFAYLNGKAFRHGDIEGILSELAKTAGHAAGGGGLLGFAQSMISAASGGAKFSKEDVKKVYFGNWLRDYSQAMDIAGLSKLTADTLVLIVGVLGFLTFGYATDEYQITADRLGVYLPVEHIDNPKGYAEKEGDARQIHPRLRPPVNPEELEIDPNTGMKNYMATENRGWDTSTAHIRRTLEACIDHGRRARGQEGADLWEAYRLLGSGLHTLEDLLAHSNWCEIALRKMGHEDVFCHVGDNVIVDTPNGPAPPLVTGTFGSADFIHSLMGEATDHLSQASVVDLSKRMNAASQGDDSSFSNLKDILHKLPIGGEGDEDSKMNEADQMKAQSKAYEFNPDNIAPPEVQEQLLNLLKWRDDVYRQVLKKIEMIPGLEDLIDALTNALNAYVYTILAPYLTPLLQQVTTVLGEGSKAVIDSDDQFEVFNNPNASDPSHSLLSKDHFALILNEPAGKIAQAVVQYSVQLLVESWFDDNVDPNQVIDQILEAFHHPYHATGQSRIQQQMFEEMEKWIGALGPEEAERTLQALTKESVREGQNKRQGSDDDLTQSDQVYGGGLTSTQGGYRTSVNQSYGGSQIQGQGSYGSSGQGYNTSGGQGSSQAEYNSGGGYGQSQESSYGRQPSQSYGDSGGYGSRRDDGRSSRRQEPSYGSGGTEGYGSGDRIRVEDTPVIANYGTPAGYRPSETQGRAGTEGYSSGGYGAGRTERYSGSDATEEHHHGRKHYEESETRGDSYGSSGGYGGSTHGSSDTYGSRRREEGGYDAPSQLSGGYGSTTSEFARSGGDDEYGSGRHRTQDPYSNSGFGQEDRQRESAPSVSYNRDDSSGYGGQERERGSVSGQTYGSSGYGRPEETSTYGEGRRQQGYGDESSGRGAYGSSGYGGGYGGTARSSEYGSSEPHQGRHRGRDDAGGSDVQSGYGNEDHGRRGGFGGGYGERGETFGAEKLKLDSDSDDEGRHGKHKKHHRKDSD